MSHVSDDTLHFVGTDSIEEKPKKRWHAHWDCFSGAAGDMMLAACLDAAAGKNSSVTMSESSIEWIVSVYGEEVDRLPLCTL
jgi:hypothetical protein